MRISIDTLGRIGVVAGLIGAFAAIATPALAQTAARVATVQTTSAAAPVARHGSDLLTFVRHHTFAATTAAATLSYPYGIAVGHSSEIYVTNLFGGVNIYNTSLKKTGAITAGVNFPAAVATSFNGNIYVANNGGNNVTIYNPSLTKIGTITDPSLVSPTSMFVDSDDTVWVLDGGGTLHAYLNDGTTLPSTHTGGNTIGPWGPNVTVWGIANASGGYDETYENRAQAVQDGPSLYNDYVNGSPYAGGEAEDADAQEYVSDLLHNQIQIWSRGAAYQVGQINTPAAPYGVAVDSALGRVYVVMTTLNQVYCYSTKAPYKLIAIMK